MNYHDITYPDVNNGIGLRVTLWLSGCSHHCKNCQNPQTWNPESGRLFDESAKISLFQALDKDYISGITFSGGDPLHKSNLFELSDLIKEIKEKYPMKNIWLYSGYSLEQILLDEAPENWVRKSIVLDCDVFVDGKYIDEFRDVTLQWRGSKNQRVIDINDFKKGLYCDKDKK